MGRPTMRGTAGSRTVRLEPALLGLLLLFGASFAFLTPPFQVPDEPQHFYRAFEISEGRLLPIGRDGQSGDFLPVSLPRVAGTLLGNVPFHEDVKVQVASIRAAAAERVEPGERAFVGFLTSAYSFVPYLPQASGIALARLFSDSVLVTFYAGRLSSVVVSALLFAAAIRVVPVGRPIFFLLPMAPMAIFQMASLSADAFTNSFCFLFIARVLQCALSPGRRLDRAEAARFLLFSIVLGLTKPGYILLPGLLLLVPAERAGSVRKRTGFAVLFLGAAAAASLAWSLVIRSIYPPFHGAAHLDPARQLHDVVLHPFDAARIALGYYWREAPVLANQYIGKLGWVDTRLPPAFVVAFFLSLLVVAATSGDDGPWMSRRQRGALLLVLLFSLAWMTALLYVVFTPYGMRTIGSTQGRYFIPLGPLALLALLNRRWRIPWREHGEWLIAWAIVTEGVALASLVRRFYF